MIRKLENRFIIHAFHLFDHIPTSSGLFQRYFSRFFFFCDLLIKFTNNANEANNR